MLIRLKGLSKTYRIDKIKIPALSSINLSIKKGEFVTIMGPSGSGKSTLMNIVGCLDKPTKGKYFLDDEDISQKKDKDLAKIRGKKIGFVFQSFNLLPRYSILRNVELPLVYLGLKRKERKQKATWALKLVGLGNKTSRKPNELSGGEVQRVAIARALVTNPAVILADEPTGNLDSKTGISIMNLLQDLNKKRVTIIVVTHEKLIADFAKKIIHLKDGRIEEVK